MLSTSPDRILLTSIKVFPGTINFLSLTESFNSILRMDIRCPSKEMTLRILFFISNNSPVINLLLSVSAIEKIVCLITSFKVN